MEKRYRNFETTAIYFLLFLVLFYSVSIVGKMEDSDNVCRFVGMAGSFMLLLQGTLLLLVKKEGVKATNSTFLLLFAWLLVAIIPVVWR